MVSFQKAGKFILSGVDVHIPEGVTVGVIGASGAGKTTLLKLACGLLECACGVVRTMGKDPVRQRRAILADLRAYFSENFYFDGDDTVLHQFQLLESVYPLGKERDLEEYKKLADLFHFSSDEGKCVGQLSLGQRRRVELASVLLGNARLFVFDEPTNGLDDQGKQEFWRQLRRKKDSGATVLLSSHNMQEVGTLCDRIILLDRGSVVYYGDRAELLHRYAPTARVEVQFAGRIPDMEDLPLLRYSVEGDMLDISYHAGKITAAEIVQHIVGQTEIVRINIIRQNLADVVLHSSDAVADAGKMG